MLVDCGFFQGGKKSEALDRPPITPKQRIDAVLLTHRHQAEGSLGRRLVNGEKIVSVHGEKIAMKAQVHTLGGFSAHAGQTDLLAWFKSIAPCKPRVVLTHGEDEPRAALAQKIQQQFRLACELPKMGGVVEL